MDDLTKAIVSFALGAVGSYLALVWKVRKDLEAAYDKDLRDRRLVTYVTLWAHLEPLAKYARRGPVNGAILGQLSEQLRHWYFADGGIYLSDDTRDAYFKLQEQILEYLTGDIDEQKALGASEFEALRRSGSGLRTCMARDVGTRRRPMVEGEPAA